MNLLQDVDNRVLIFAVSAITAVVYVLPEYYLCELFKYLVP